MFKSRTPAVLGALALGVLASAPLAQAGVGVQKHPDGLGLPQKHPDGFAVPQKRPDIIAVLRMNRLDVPPGPTRTSRLS
jgi:hypothetical protein